MILTGASISSFVASGGITIEPFDPLRLGTVSYHFRAGTKIARLKGYYDSKRRSVVTYENISKSGYIIEPGSVYLLSTSEILGSTIFAQRICGTRTTGSCGLFIDVSADLGHVGCVTRWTLELVPQYRMLIFPLQTIGQITFWALGGAHWAYRGSYNFQKEPRPSMLWKQPKENQDGSV